MTLTTDLILAWAAGVATIGVVLGGFWRLLLPWVRQQISGPVGEIHQQVTKNHHTSDPPTLVDRLDNLHDEVRAMRRDQTELVTWKQYEHRNFHTRLDVVERRLDALGPRPEDS